jgi:hypothetical protein
MTTVISTPVVYPHGLESRTDRPDNFGRTRCPHAEIRSARERFAEPPNTQHSHAPRPDTFQRTGRLWRISFAGVEDQVRDSRGLRYYACLLGKPVKAIGVGQLWGLANRLELEDIGVTEAEAERDMLIERYSTRESDEPVFDAAYLEAIAKEVAEYEHMIDRAKTHDPGAVLSLRQEQGRLLGHLSGDLHASQEGSCGIGADGDVAAAASGAKFRGKRRLLESAAERLRLGVFQALKRARLDLKRRGPAMAALAAFLQKHVQTGNTCVYTPPPEHPGWQT